MCSYLFVVMAYGMMMQEAGFAWYDSLLASLTIYTGAFQFVLITFSLRTLPFFRHGAVCDRSHRLLCVLFSGNTKSKPHDPGNAVYETAVKWYNDVT